MSEPMRVRDLCMKLLEAFYTVRFRKDIPRIVVSKDGMPDLEIALQTAREVDSETLLSWVKAREGGKA